jgi:uncharacterized protein (DUF2062 family)
MKKLNKRSLAYYYFKLVKQSGEPDYIARGVGLGLFIGLFIPFGLQIAVVLPLAVFLKAAKIPAVAFTFITNQITIFVIYPVQCVVGSYLVGHPMHYSHFKNMLKGVFKADTIMEKFNALFEMGKEVVIAFFAGGALFGIVIGVAGYFLALWLVKRHRRKKLLKKQKAYGIVHSA